MKYLYDTIARFRSECAAYGIDPSALKITIEFPNREQKTRAAQVLFLAARHMIHSPPEKRFIPHGKEYEFGVNTFMGVQFNLTVRKCPTCKRDQ